MVKPEVYDVESSDSTRIQVTCNRIFPLNKLFEHWLIELGAEAHSKEKKSTLSFNRALCSLRMFPSELHSTEEAKTLLLHFGARICAELDKRLEVFRLQYGFPTLENVQGYLKSQSKNVGLPCLVNQNLQKRSTVKQQANEETTQTRQVRLPATIRTKSVKVGSGTVASRRRSQDYVPKYRSGGFAILRALYEFSSGTSGEWLETVELQKVAQQFCDEYIGPSTRNQPFTAWAARKTLINNNMIEVRRSKGNEYRLTLKGRSTAERFAKALEEQKCDDVNTTSHAKGLLVRHGLPGARYQKFCEPGPSFFNDGLKQRSELTEPDLSGDSKTPAPEDEPLFSRNFVILENESGNIDEVARDASTSGLQALRCPECGCSHRVMENSKFHLTLLVDHSETKGGPNGRYGPVSQRQTSRAKMRSALAQADIRFEERDLNLGDYLWVLQSRSDKSLEFVVDVIIERKRIDDLAQCIMGKEARYREQKFRLKRCGVARIIYLVEGCVGIDSMADCKKAAIRGACSKTRVIDNFDVVKTANVAETVEYLQAMTDYIRRKLVLPIWVCTDTDGDGTFEEPKHRCCRKLMHCMKRFHQFNSKGRKQRAWTVTETFARMLLQFNGISAERAQEIINLYPTVAHLIDVYRELEESSKTQASSETQRLDPLAAIQSGSCKRNIGKVSENIDHFFTSVKPFSS
ncbi:crossover junction endonuclease MUS81 [Trichuris trichiura]|uniref:Crossover junction endonuclease MUS81 n=1 Tax=Trichuris trichiura TaxID=36087 RepID=A0A077Z2G3_TRITR|nr:crossover junction endonuclease MUS81 [Trichuris trichiura]